jgi:hypothetical protein
MHFKALFWAKNLESQMEAIADAILRVGETVLFFLSVQCEVLVLAFHRHCDQHIESLQVIILLYILNAVLF